MDKIYASTINERVINDYNESINNYPLCPPNYYGNSNYHETNKLISRSWYNYLANSRENKYNKKKNVDGSLYLFPYVQGYYYINTTVATNYDIYLYENKLLYSGIRIRMFNNELELIKYICLLGSLVGNKGNARCKQRDFGEMYALGYRDYEK